MLDQDAAREFERLRAHLGFASEPERLRIDGRYRIERALGRGAMGVVHLAHDERLDRKVALKLVRTRAHVDHERLQLRLEREARALARVEHPNIVAVYDVGSHEDQPYLTMQYVPGLTLREWQAEREPSPAQIVDAYLQAARGLAAAHAGRVIHRDFKPDNALVSEQGLVQVADFGIAAALQLDGDPTGARASLGDDPGDEIETQPESGSRLTQTGSFVGTLAYAAPEQLRGEPADARSDQFSLCVALWEALCGKRPFEGRTRQQLEDATHAPPRHGEALPAWLHPILRRGLAREPAQRFESMDALVRAIEHGRSRRRRRAIAVVSGLGLTIAALAGWGLSTAAQRAAQPGCDEFVAEVDEVWSAARREALLTGAAPGASEAAEYAASTLDELTRDWGTSAAALCHDGLAPAPELDERRCHEAWLEGLERNVDLLVEHGDSRTLERAPDLLDRLVAPQGDYCALRPSPVVDPEVWSLAESAREAAIVGDPQRAQQQAQAALARAAALGDGELSPHLAEAQAARAEVLARGGDLPGALALFPVAERQAIGTTYQLRLWWLRVLWAKVLALSEAPDAGERALEQLQRAEPLAHALGQDDSLLLRAELAEARGMVERARGDQHEAIAQHQLARESFAALGRPLQRARALLGIGTSHQLLGELEAARVAYQRAEAIYAEAGVPPSYRNLLQTRINLGMLAAVELRADGLPPLEQVVRHGSPEERLVALTISVMIAEATQPPERVVALAERALEELAAQPDASPKLAHDIELGAGRALASLGDPRGEPLMHAAELRAELLPDDVWARTQQTWIEWLEIEDRCPEARQRLASLDERMTPELRAERPDWPSWRQRRSDRCASELAPESPVHPANPVPEEDRP